MVWEPATIEAPSRVVKPITEVAPGVTVEFEHRRTPT
jgi:hypothetical protein